MNFFGRKNFEGLDENVSGFFEYDMLSEIWVPTKTDCTEWV